MSNKEIHNAQQLKQHISIIYGVPVSSIVWAGGHKYIIVKNNKEIIHEVTQ
jgi:hypothetical protein